MCNILLEEVSLSSRPHWQWNICFGISLTPILPPQKRSALRENCKALIFWTLDGSLAVKFIKETHSKLFWHDHVLFKAACNTELKGGRRQIKIERENLMGPKLVKKISTEVVLLSLSLHFKSWRFDHRLGLFPSTSESSPVWIQTSMLNINEKQLFKIKQREREREQHGGWWPADAVLHAPEPQEKSSICPVEVLVSKTRASDLPKGKTATYFLQWELHKIINEKIAF